MPRLTHGTIERGLNQVAQSRTRKTLADGEGRGKALGISGIGLSLLLLCGSAHGQSGTTVEEFYRGKTIAVVCPFDAEGGYGFVTRAIAQYLPKYLPGRPKGIPQLRPGANGIVAAGHMYNVAER